MKPFCLDLTEVTVDAYAACVASGTCTAPKASGAFCNWGASGKGNHPINCVAWSQATAFCSAEHKRLPTEEEWVWAARGGNRGAYAYPWGNAEPRAQLCWKRVDEGTCAVGSFAAGDNPWGVHDLAGNVSEWVVLAGSGLAAVRGGTWNVDLASVLTERVGDARVDGSRNDEELGFRCAR